MKNYLIVVLLLFPTIVIAQKDPIKWGKISEEERALTVVPYDSSATAVILCDYGRVLADRSSNVIFRRHVRIKILDESAKDRADIAIPYYHAGGSEVITNKIAHTINVVDGKPVKAKVDKKDFFKVKVNDKWSELRFTFPDVKAGSIIEYSYATESENFTSLENWYFQNDLPTLKSHFFASIGAGLNYKIMYQGRSLIEKYGNKAANTWVLTDLPAIKDEPYCPNTFDYTDKIKFQLSSYLYNGAYVDVMKSWSSVAKDLYNKGGMRQFLNKNKDAKEIVEQIIKQEDTEEQKVEKIYQYVTNSYTWNNSYSMFPQEDYRDFKSKAVGNSAEINLFFINLIQSAGLDAKPALLSTKAHGLIAKDITFYSQFNHVIACIKINGKDQLIDATNRFRPYNLLAEADLNEDALVLDKKEPYWLPLKPNKQTKNIKLITMEIPQPGLVKYKYELNAKGYEAVDAREGLAKANNELETYFNKALIKENTEYKISNITSKDIEDIDKPIYLSAEIEDNTLSTVNDDYIYLSPFVDQYLDANPFNGKERYFPIDFYHPFENMYILTLQIPEGYEVIEYPEAINLATVDQKGFIKTITSVNGDKLQMRVSFKIANPFFIAQEYPILREIYDHYIEKREEQIVLKKKA